jgi:chemotaxis protein MotB
MSKPSGAKKKRGHGGGHDEEHENHERWLVSYADMMTLLMVLFVVMFAMSNVDTRKFQDLAAGLADGFGAQSVTFNGKQANLDGKSADAVTLPIKAGADPELDSLASTVPDQELEQIGKEAVARAGRTKASQAAQAAAEEVQDLKEVQRQITQALAKEKLENEVTFTIDERGLIVTVVTSDIVFGGDSAVLRTGGTKIVDAIAATLRRLPNNIQVDGHTNQVRGGTADVWELSTARATAVVKRLSSHRVPTNRLAASGYADSRPLIDPADPRSVTMNRRVEIIVLSTLPPDQAALLPSAAGSPSTASTAPATESAHE